MPYFGAYFGPFEEGAGVPVVITPETRAQNIIEDIRQTLENTTVDAEPVFAAAAVYDDLASFTRVANPMKAGGPVAGVIASAQPQRAAGTSNLESYVERLALQIAVSFKLTRKAGAGEQSAVGEMNRLAAVIRAALAVDVTRGGNAKLIGWSGAPLNCTDTNGQARLQSSAPNASFHVFTVDIFCGWYESA